MIERHYGTYSVRAVLNGIFFGSMLLLNTAKNGTHNLFVFAVLNKKIGSMLHFGSTRDGWADVSVIIDKIKFDTTTLYSVLQYSHYSMNDKDSPHQSPQRTYLNGIVLVLLIHNKMKNLITLLL